MIPETEHELGPWNPGIESTLPREFLPLATIYRPENVTANLAALHELSDFSGIALQDLVIFRPDRLAVHELLIRVTADFSVPDGNKYADLGTNFREIVTTILENYIAPHIKDIEQIHSNLREAASSLIDRELRTCFGAPTPSQILPPEPRGFFGRVGLGSKPRPSLTPVESGEERDLRILSRWRDKAEAAQTELERRTYHALLRVASAVCSKRGRLIGDGSVLSALAMPIICNEYGSEAVGEHIEQYIQRAVSEEGYKLLPSQSRPVVMNVKGASASGKSTMRPLQKQLAERLGIRWEEFALISPDIWRKFLLDYNSLGPAQRYAGTLTGQEVAIIDKKLDRYMSNKGEQGRISHLLIDRFRFDSFDTRPDKEDGSGLLTRFGHLIYMFFMITPPEATVERAWKRGQQFGRYKAVDDLLYHNVEAYTGMPRLFFTWAAKQNKEVHFEFLDNSVPEGSRPRTVAFGKNGEMNILDITRLLDVERFKKINLNAREPAGLYAQDLLAAGKNTDFLRLCARRLPKINFVDYESGRIYAKVRGGKLTRDVQDLGNPDIQAGLAAVEAELTAGPPSAPEPFETLKPEDAYTLGTWGCDRSKCSSSGPA